jgi:hypothetical protein
VLAAKLRVSHALCIPLKIVCLGANLLRYFGLFEHLYRQALAPEHDCERGARSATANDENIGHLFCFPGAFVERLTLRNFHQAGQFPKAQVADSFEAHSVHRRFCSVLHARRTW